MFYPIHYIVKAWKDNMKTMFQEGCITCLYESIRTFISWFRCPEFVFCHINPWPFGNEWHITVCGLSYIIFSLSLLRIDIGHRRSGRSHIIYLGGIQLVFWWGWWRLYFGSGIVVVLDSVFCVFKGIIWLRHKGLFVEVVIKKCL